MNRPHLLSGLRDSRVTVLSSLFVYLFGISTYDGLHTFAEIHPGEPGLFRLQFLQLVGIEFASPNQHSDLSGR